MVTLPKVYSLPVIKINEPLPPTLLKSICVEFGPGSYVVNYGFIYVFWLTSMPGTPTWKMLTFSQLELISSTAYMYRQKCVLTNGTVFNEN